MFSEDNLHCYGTSLPLLELDQVPNKKSCYVQDQIATDDEGRRRFHGAFTGGFSAGYWNTVGSKDGWTPSQFKSSRTDKAVERLNQRPEDFMDDEDKSIFGIAPKAFKIREDYTAVEQEAKRKRKLLNINQDPLRGEPVLKQLLKPVKDKVSMRILKAWGWRQGQGVGPRQTRHEKKKAQERNKRELYLMEKYGCDIDNNRKSSEAEAVDPAFHISKDEDDDDDSDEMSNITFAPENYDMPPCSTKLNRYGLGYKCLRQKSLFHEPLYDEKNNERSNICQTLRLLDKNDRPISFTGEAFGIGALEDDDDEDLFAKDDLTRYDFSLEDKNDKIGKTPSCQSVTAEQHELVFEEFLLNRHTQKHLKNWMHVEIPFNWKPRNWLVKKKRFEPMDPRQARQLEEKFGQMQQESNRKQRVEILGESLKTNKKPSLQDLQNMYKEREKKTKALLEKISSKSESFIKGGIITEQQSELVIKETELHAELGTEKSNNTFKPFSNNVQKQKRYDEFLKSNLLVEEDIEKFLDKLQPKEMSYWDKRTELKEFMQARKLYQPLQGAIAERFVTETQIKKETESTEKQQNIGDAKQIKFERQTKMWKPQALLCKRFNIPEPFGGHIKEEELKSKATKKLSVFDYLETSVNKKEDFQTPQIFPKLQGSSNLAKNEEKQQQPQQQQQPSILENQELNNNDLKTVLPLENSTPPDIILKKRFVAKTALEKEVVESLNKRPTEKKELFKAIFLDDDDVNDVDDINDKNEKHNNKAVTTKSTVEIPTILTTSAAAINLLRNNSPPRGIFKALFSFNSNDRTQQKSEKSNNQENKNLNLTDKMTKVTENKITFQPKINKDMYGPALPIRIIESNNSHSSNQSVQSSTSHINHYKDNYKQNEKDSEIWIEKSHLNEIKGIDDNNKNSSRLSGSNEHSKHKKKKLKKKSEVKTAKKNHKRDKKHKKKKKKV